MEFTAKIDIQPELQEDNERKACISVYLQQIKDLTPGVYSTVSISPVIVARNTIPSDSPIFNLVKKGDLDGLKSLLLQRKASLWSSDPKGRSLINVCHLVFCSLL